MLHPSPAIAAANLASYRPPQRTTRPSPTDFGGTDEDIDVIVGHMNRITLNSLAEPTVKTVASECRRITASETAFACFSYVVGHMSYQSDKGGEVLKSPRITLSAIEPHGDCDDMSMALAALLLKNGIECQFKVIAWRRWEFTHVYVVAKLPDIHPRLNWIPLDPVMKGDGFGSERGVVLRTKHYPITRTTTAATSQPSRTKLTRIL